MRLRRGVAVAEGLYTTLKTRYAEAQLAEAGATPDLTVLDSAVAPLNPSKNTSTSLMAIAVLGGLGAAIGLALLLDAMDGKLRYPDQVVNELGMTIAAAIPKFPKGAMSGRSPDQIAHLVEAFRSLRIATTSLRRTTRSTNEKSGVWLRSPIGSSAILCRCVPSPATDIQSIRHSATQQEWVEHCCPSTRLRSQIRRAKSFS